MLTKHHLSRYPVLDWVHQQVYLHPYPKELMLRNHVWTSGSTHRCLHEP
jgi:uncharacterized protein YbgA (DUF1722 family)